MHFPPAAAGRLVFVSTHPDQNLWTVPIDRSTGVSEQRALRRLTRGPGVMMYLSVTGDDGLLSYWATRSDVRELRLRNLRDDSDRVLTTGSAAPDSRLFHRAVASWRSGSAPWARAPLGRST